MQMTALSRLIEADVPVMTRRGKIPSVLHQIFFPAANLPQRFIQCAARVREQNPTWEYRLHDETVISNFITREYGPLVLEAFNKISPYYGAAKADLFRYLLMYKEGGVYLDIKSGLSRPLNQIIKPDDQFIVCNWYRSSENGRESFGRDAALKHIKEGALQQWHIICAPGHPFMRAVILRVLSNIFNYSPWRDGTGGSGTFAVTGPVAYTLAITPIMNEYEHRLTNDNEAGLIYRQFDDSHRVYFPGHYLARTDSVIQADNFAGKVSGLIYSAARTSKRLMTRAI